MNDHDDVVNQEQTEGQDFRKKVAHALSKDGTVEELQAHPEDAMTLHLNDDEAVVMHGDELDAWLAEEDNRQAYLDALDQRKSDDLRADDYKREDDYKKEDAERDRDMASAHDEADADIGEFSLGEERLHRTTEPERKQAIKAQDRKNDVEPYDQTSVSDSRLYDIYGNQVTSRQIDDIMRSRAELKQHLDNERRTAQLASGYDREAVRARDREQANDTRADYHQSVSEEATGQAKQTAGQENTSPSTKKESTSASPEGSALTRGQWVRARAAQIATSEGDDWTRKQNQVQSR